MFPSTPIRCATRRCRQAFASTQITGKNKNHRELLFVSLGRVESSSSCSSLGGWWKVDQSSRRSFSSSAQFADPPEVSLLSSTNEKSSQRQFSSSIVPPEDGSSPTSAAVSQVEPDRAHQRIWLPHSLEEPLFWSEDVVHGAESNPHDLAKLLERIETQEVGGGRMRSKQYGVLHEDPAVDMRLLTENYTVTSLAAALRDREDVLQHCAVLAEQNEMEALKDYLKMFHPDLVLNRRNQKRQLDVTKPLTATSLETIRKALMRMPRRVVQAHSRRAGVVIPIVHVDGVPSLLLEKRSPDLRAHPDEVCLPGGMVCSVADRTIVETCLREFKEEIGGLEFDYHQKGGGSHGVSVLGVLRCNWGEVHHM